MTSAKDVEEEYARSCNVPFAVLLPSGRAGILWALMAATSIDTRVIAPAFTCQVVHEAVIRASRQLNLTDIDESSFLMAEQELLAAVNGKRHGLILGEIYGYKYSANLIKKLTGKAALCIHDFAMSIPESRAYKDFNQKDFAIISFGIGKSMYSGWGAIGLTHSEPLVREIEDIRDRSLSQSTVLLKYKRTIEILARTLAHEDLLYGLTRKLKERFTSRRQEASSPCKHGSGVSNLIPLSKEWYLPSTQLDRMLAIINLEHREYYSQKRLTIARRYENNLQGAPGLVLAPLSNYPLSHYTIQVDSAKRDSIRTYLWKEGIDTGVLFPNSAYLGDKEGRNSRIASAKIINLPINTNLSSAEIDKICEKVLTKQEV